VVELYPAITGGAGHWLAIIVCEIACRAAESVRNRDHRGGAGNFADLTTTGCAPVFSPAGIVKLICVTPTSPGGIPTNLREAPVRPRSL